MSVQVEIALMWAAVMAYAVSSALFIAGTVFVRKRMLTVALAIASAGLVLQTVSYALRWMRVGHAPYLGFYEVVSAYAFAGVLTLVILSWARPRLRPVGIVIMPVSLLVLGASMFADKTGEAVGGSLSSWWLSVHVLFAKLAYSSFIVAFGLAIIFLIRESGHVGRAREVLDRLPGQAALDDSAYRFAAVGLIFLSVMIVAGAIWANEAWGRYWAWDPIETWSLVTWFVYAVYIHLRLTLGWRGKKSAWLLIAALPVVAFSFVVVPIVYNSIHGAYIEGV